MLELSKDERACWLFKTLADNAKVATGRLYGEYGLALISVREQATGEARSRLEKIYREIARRGNGNVLMVLAHNLFQQIFATSEMSAPHERS